LRLLRAADRWGDRVKRWLQRRRDANAGPRRRHESGGALDHLTREAAMLRDGADPDAVGLRQVHDKAIGGGLEHK
jgi:hypothetical protein